MRLNGFLAHRFKFVIDDHPTIPNVQVVTHTVKASEVRRYSSSHSEPWHRMEVGGKLQAPTAKPPGLTEYASVEMSRLKLRLVVEAFTPAISLHLPALEDMDKKVIW